MKQISGCFDLQSGDLVSSSIAVNAYEDAAVLVEVYGTVTCKGTVNDGRTIASAYAISGFELSQELTGLYVLLIYDKLARRLTVFHDRATSPVTMYYTQYDGKLFYGTSLKTVLWQSDCPQKLNEAVLEEFLLNGYIYGRQTLAAGIEKIEAFHALTAGSGVVEQVEVSYAPPTLTKGQALDAFADTLDEAILRCVKDESEVCAPLSSGYDSSYIVHTLHEKTELPVTAFSIGGKFGKNELPQVKENAALYDRVALQTALTDNDTLQHLPDIVWRLEGNVYENGVFLQYELAKLVKEHRKSFLVCGECADQVMNRYYWYPDRLHPQSDVPMYYEFSEYPYIFGHYLILKKSGILFNSFGIETRYPYLSDDVVAACAPLCGICEKDKRIHTANCKERLPEAVIANIQKIGGATEVHSLFENKAAMDAFIKAVEASDFYQKYADIIARCDRTEAPQQGVAKLKTTVRNTVLNALHIGREGRERDAYFHEEMKLRQYFYYAYVILFEKLILSGDYNARFGSEGIDEPLSKLL